MTKAQILKRMSCIGTLVLLFGAASAHAQSTTQGGSATPAGPAASAGASASSKAESSIAKADRKMMNDMAQANLAEIQAGKLAADKAQDQDVKQFAQKMVEEHTQAQKELEQLAQTKGVTLPASPDSKHQAMMKNLSALSGEKFDREYMSRGGVADHKATRDLLKRVEDRAKDADLKALAGKALAAVEEHLHVAQDLHSEHATKSAATKAEQSGATASGASGIAGSGASGAAETNKGSGPPSSGSSATKGSK